MFLESVAGIHQVEAGMLLSYKNFALFTSFQGKYYANRNLSTQENKSSVSNKSGFYIKM